MKLEKEIIKPEITLKEIEDFAIDKFLEYGLCNHIWNIEDWDFGFDLAPVRGGICRYGVREISLSVTYCACASRDAVLDTVLHEIAHALVGAGHHHDKVWKKKALEIGCTGEIYHSVPHGLDRWRGTCPCGHTWRRQKLIKKMRKATCSKCSGRITWTNLISMESVFG